MLARYKHFFQKFHLIASVLPFSFAMKNLFFLEKMYCKNVLRPLLHIPAHINLKKRAKIRIRISVRIWIRITLRLGLRLGRG